MSPQMIRRGKRGREGGRVGAAITYDMADYRLAPPPYFMALLADNRNRHIGRDEGEKTASQREPADRGSIGVTPIN